MRYAARSAARVLVAPRSRRAPAERLRGSGRLWRRSRRQKLNRARFYQPSIGRFSQEDPLHDVSAERHWYRYARNQPTTGRDPSGLWTVGIFVDGQGGAGAGGGLSKIYVFDGHGNVGVQYSAAAGGVGGAGASATVGIQVTNAETICDLKGFTGNPGVGLGEVVVLGVDALIAETYKGGQVSIGLGATAPGFAIPAVFYGFGSWTTMGFHVNVYDLLQRIYGDKVEFGLTPSPTDPQCSCKRN